MENNRNTLETQVLISQDDQMDEDSMVEAIAEPIIKEIRSQFGKDFDYSLLEGSVICISKNGDGSGPEIDEGFISKVQDYIRERLMEDQIMHILH